MSRFANFLAIALAMALSGCVNVTTRSTNSPRTGTEQLLLTGTSDRAVGSIDFRPLAGHRVFLEATPTGAADSGWITFSLRREMARQGLLLVADKKEAQTLVELAISAYGTDEADSRISLPTSFSLGAIPLPTGISDASGFYRKSRQDAVVKLALFAYDVETRQMVWESNTVVECGHLDQKFLGTTNISRQTSVPELETYPPSRIRYDKLLK